MAGRFSTTEPWDDGHGMVIPARMLPGIVRYFEHGILPGEFWQACLRNDLREACGRADDQNRLMIPAYVSYLYNVAPGPCWGSPEKVEAWVARFQPGGEKAQEIGP
jgi:hypothetical protein